MTGFRAELIGRTMTMIQSYTSLLTSIPKNVNSPATRNKQFAKVTIIINFVL